MHHQCEDTQQILISVSLKTKQQERSKYIAILNKNNHYRETFETLSIQAAKNANQKVNKLENIEIKEIFHSKIRL